MNRFDIFALAAATVVTLLSARISFHAAEFYRDFLHLSGAMSAIGVAGWIVATYGPIAIAAWFWRWAKRVRRPWVLHLLFLPCAVMTLRVGGSLMLFVIEQPDFDAMIGAPVIPAILLFVVTVGGYLSALLFARVRRSTIRAATR